MVSKSLSINALHNLSLIPGMTNGDSHGFGILFFIESFFFVHDTMLSTMFRTTDK